jgi:ribosome-binding protein aMBF1 (putative translation factor)
MTATVEKKTRRTRSREEREALDVFLGLRQAQRERVCQLARLYQGTENEEEQNEIWEVMAEILFPNPRDMVATKIDDERSRDSGNTLAKHREYVGTQIKKWRRRLRMSQEELAKKAGIPQSHVCRLETGKHAPSYLTIERLATALGVKPSQLDPGFDD